MEGLVCSHRYIDPVISNLCDNNLSLHLILHRKSIEFSLVCESEHRLYALANYQLDDQFPFEDNLSKLIEKDNLLESNFDYKNIYYSLYDSQSCLIPNEIFQEEKQSEMLALLFTEMENKSISNTENSYLKARIICSQKPIYKQVLVKHFPKIKYIDRYQILLNLWQSQIKLYKKNDYQIIIQVNPISFDLLVAKDKKLVFLNSFPALSKEEILYYCLYALNKLKIDLGSATSFIAGKSQEKEVYSFLDKHFHDLRYLQAPEYFVLNQDLDFSRIYLLSQLYI